MNSIKTFRDNGTDYTVGEANLIRRKNSEKKLTKFFGTSIVISEPSSPSAHALPTSPTDRSKKDLKKFFGQEFTGLQRIDE